jgi:hypothetical protein
MNLGRFHAAIYSIKQEIKSDSNFELLTELQTNLQNSISQQTPDAAKIFKDSYSFLIDTLERANSNFTFPTRRKIYQVLGATKHIGAGLLERIKNVISENQIAPANALAEIQGIYADSKDFFDKIIILDKTFSELEIDYDELKSGEFEIGFSFPHEVVGTDIASLEKEFHQLDFALKTLQEISLGKVGEVNIKTISASEWQVFLDSLPELAACTAIAIERIVALYKNNLEIKLIKQQLEDKKLPQEITQPLQDHIKNSVKLELRKIAEEIVDSFYTVQDEGRKNELKNQASQALQYLASRMDHGATVEVHASPPDKPIPETKKGEEEPTIGPDVLAEYQRVNEIAVRVNNSSKLTLELEQSSGPILSINFE